MFVEIVSTLSAAITTALGIQASKNKPSTKTNTSLLSYNFTAAHTEVQQRIDRILGSGFYTKPAINSFYGGSAGYYTLGMKPDSKTGLDINRYTQLVEFPTGSHVYIDQLNGALNIDHNYKYFAEVLKKGIDSGALKFAPFVITSYNKNLSKGEKGWGDVSWLSSKNIDEAAQKIFNAAVTCTPTNCPFGKALQFGTPNDTYKAYSYPSYEVAKQYGENLSLFVHCNPENLGCQWFGKDINASFTTIVLFLAGVALTIATVGVGTVAVLSAITSLASQVANFVGIKSNDIDKAGKVVTEAVNIVNGADIEVKNGTKQDVINISNKIISVVKP